uniref:Uncharacterized protein n=2 Tax=Anguilla anguilla TaxID=7936 RepID=A0A0E9US05_ANGAN
MQCVHMRQYIMYYTHTQTHTVLCKSLRSLKKVMPEAIYVGKQNTI